MRRNTQLKVVAGFALCAALAACNTKPTAIPFLDRVLTVDEFTQQADMRKRVIDACHANPGELGQDPNCINAAKSAEAQFTKGNIPKF
ncbi:EexN family lipoprotein [Burkholderia sp. TSV86]|uniref:EexN family lipoprotein n=1 Tax=Burkholderia sp. TSV86 TaxID=1385594 RepID=UPI00075B5086|nr:EexN family lipoprotein [Burkholderia sp. TSV86]KVE37220.1 hypothetical protein WS68_03130 [Burkholderia sp. TSV86]